MREFRSRLRAGDLLIGAGVTFNDPLVSDALADSADFLCFDLEHVKRDPAALNAHLMAVRGVSWMQLGSDFEYLIRSLDEGIASLERVKRVVTTTNFK